MVNKACVDRIRLQIFTRTSVFEQKDQTSAFVSKIDMESGQYLCTKLNICGPNVVFFLDEIK